MTLSSILSSSKFTPFGHCLHLWLFLFFLFLPLRLILLSSLNSIFILRAKSQPQPGGTSSRPSEFPVVSVLCLRRLSEIPSTERAGKIAVSVVDFLTLPLYLFVTSSFFLCLILSSSLSLILFFPLQICLFYPCCSRNSFFIFFINSTFYFYFFVLFQKLFSILTRNFSKFSLFLFYSSAMKEEVLAYGNSLVVMLCGKVRTDRSYDFYVT